MAGEGRKEEFSAHTYHWLVDQSLEWKEVALG